MLVQVLLQFLLGIKIFSWLASIYGGEKNTSILTLYIKSFIILFILGGITGIIISNALLDIIYHDTYFIIGHFHTILSIGAVIGVKIGIIRYNRIIIGYIRNSLLSKIEFYTFIIGVLIIFIPHHILGIEGMPRRYKDYPIMYKKWQEISTIGSIISLISLFLYLYIFYLQFKNKILYSSYNSPSFFFFNKIYGRSLDTILYSPSPYHLYPNTPIILFSRI